MKVWIVEERRYLFGINWFNRSKSFQTKSEAEQNFYDTRNNLGYIGRALVPMVCKTELRLYRHGDGWSSPTLSLNRWR